MQNTHKTRKTYYLDHNKVDTVDILPHRWRSLTNTLVSDVCERFFFAYFYPLTLCDCVQLAVPAHVINVSDDVCCTSPTQVWRHGEQQQLCQTLALEHTARCTSVTCRRCRRISCQFTVGLTVLMAIHRIFQYRRQLCTYIDCTQRKPWAVSWATTDTHTVTYISYSFWSYYISSYFLKIFSYFYS